MDVFSFTLIRSLKLLPEYLYRQTEVWTRVDNEMHSKLTEMLGSKGYDQWHKANLAASN